MAFQDFFRKLVTPGDFGTPQKGDNDEREYFGRGMMAEFLRGELALMVQSSWLAWVKYQPDREALIVGFKDGHVQPYGDVSYEEAKDLAMAPSKGKWVHANILAGYNKSTGTWFHRKPRLPA